MVPRRRRVGLVARLLGGLEPLEVAKVLLALAGLLGWMDSRGRGSVEHQEREEGSAALWTVVGRLSAREDSIEARQRLLGRQVRMLTSHHGIRFPAAPEFYGPPEPLPQSHGLMWHLLHPFG